MALKHGFFSVSLLLLSLFVLCFAPALALCTQDPELKQCQHQCTHQARFSGEQKLQCMKRCHDYIALKEDLRRAREEEEHNELAVDAELWEPHYLNGKKKQHKKKDKEKEKEKKKEEQEQEQEQKEEEDEEEEMQVQERVEDRIPYVFRNEDFTSTVETQNGRIGVLQRFSNRSELLRGIKNVRVGFLEANPQTFVAPAHFAADCLLFVAKGKAGVTMVREKKQSFNLVRGDIFMVPAGSPVYLTSRDDVEELFIIKFFQPVALPDNVETFLGNGGEYTESVYSAFSWDVLEAAFNIGRESLKKIFSLRRGGNIIKATKQQIKALGPGLQIHIWPFKANSNGPFNLLKQRPTQFNTYGKLFEANGDNYKPLRDLDVEVSYVDITQGAMVAPYFNSKSTKIAFVVEGEGRLELGSPNTVSPSPCKAARGQRAFDNINAPLSRGTVFVVPAGYPVVTVASDTDNLRILCFEVNAKGNIRFPLAGRNNIVSQMDREAKELAFDMPVELVDRLFGSQRGEFFFPGPKRGQSF